MVSVLGGAVVKGMEAGAVVEKEVEEKVEEAEEVVGALLLKLVVVPDLGGAVVKGMEAGVGV